MPVSLTRARAAKQTALRKFRQLGEVVGVGITRIRDDYAVKVNIRKPLARGTQVPSHINGVPVQVEVTGPIKPQPNRAGSAKRSNRVA
jgi:hypothetical protein